MATAEAGDVAAADGGGLPSGTQAWARLVAAGLLLLAASLLAALQAPYADAYGYAQRSLLSRLLYPIEINPTLRLAAVEGQLNGIAFAADGRIGVAVGDGGLMLITANAGLDWRQVLRVSKAVNLRGIAVSADGTTAVAVGDNDAVLVRPAPDANWKIAPAPPGEYHAVAISADGTNMWAVGALGTIVRSVDSGRSWTSVANPAQDSLYTVAFRENGVDGWAGGLEGLLYASHDGGATWTIADTNNLVPITDAPYPAGDNAVEAVDQAGNYAIAFGEEGGDGLNGAIVPAIYTPERGQPAFRLIAAAPAPSNRSSLPQAQNAAPIVSKMGPAPASSPPQAGIGAATLAPVPNAPGDAGIMVQTTPAAADPASSKPSGLAAPRRRIGTTRVTPSAKPARATLPRPNPAAELRPAPTQRSAPVLQPIVALAAIPGQAKVAGIADNRFFIDTPSAATAPLGPAFALAMADATTGWAAGTRGLLRTTADGGKTWQPQASNGQGVLTSVTALSDGKHAWAAGNEGTIVATTDGGARWFPQLRSAGPAPTGSYHRLPALWFYAALMAAAALVLIAFRSAPVPAQVGAAAIGASDAPTASIGEDRLQFAALARGISRFLRNQATSPPLTLAISGDWGTGKSSLMRMVCEDLRRYRVRPVWFNAWHHQDEEQLLAALLAAIRDEALPPFVSLRGLGYRAQLFWLRARHSWRTSLFLLFLAGALTAFFITNGLESWRQIGNIADWLGKTADGKGDSGGSNPLLVLPQVGAIVAVIAGLRRGLKSFGTDPAVLLSRTVENFKLRDASAQVNFRTRFQSQFNEVTSALPYPLVIVIDDLDRCRADTVLQVMESVNFLMSSGKCFVIFGMATHRVQAALALSFKDIAQELVELDSATPHDVSAGERDRAERAKRHKYAGEYLQKLINLEIKVPSRADIPPHLLLMHVKRDGGDDWTVAARRQLSAYALPAVVALVVAAAGWQLSTHYFRLPPAQATRPAVAPDVPIPAANGPAPQGGDPGPRRVTVPREGLSGPSEQAPAARVSPGRSGDEGRLGPLYLLAAVLAAVMIALRYRRRLEEEDVRDSAAFIEALQVWTPVVARQTPAPRAIKRFGNRLRYFAMLQNAEAAPATGDSGPAGGLLRLRRILSRPAPPTTRRAVDVVAEHRIVALGALQAVYADDWRRRIEEGFGAAPNGNGSGDFNGIEAAITAYVRRTQSRWPPSAAELDAFELSLNGIQLEGDITILSAVSGGSNTQSPPPSA